MPTLWAIEVRSALLILCLPSGVSLAYFVRPLCLHCGASSAAIVGQLVRCGAIPSVIPLLLLSFESYYEMKLQE